MKMNRYTHFPSLGILVTFLMHIAHAAAASQDQISFKKLGCFTDTNQGFLIKPLRRDIFETNITNTCIKHCERQGTLFAAVTNRTICTCGVTYDFKKKTADSTCNIQCDKDFTCGGPSAATLYQILPKSCPLPKSAGYLQLGESCYRIEGNALNWDDAERKCVSEKGHLASVHNYKENYFILSLFTAVIDVNGKLLYGTFWAGGRYESDTKEFKWADGSKWDYKHWSPGEPPKKSLKNMCMNMVPGLPEETKGTWFTNFCTFAYYSVCQRPIKGFPPEKNKPNNPILTVARGEDVNEWTGKIVPKPEGGPTSGSSPKTLFIIIGVVSAIVFVVILVAGVFLYRKYRSWRDVLRQEEGDMNVDMKLSFPIVSSPVDTGIISPVDPDAKKSLKKVKKESCQPTTMSPQHSALSDDYRGSSTESSDDI
eukprot:Tbor_TRINITY_DN6003_c0_g3::TRINITY_DN6003_c0_g3_i5::g.11617::m.11617